MAGKDASEAKIFLCETTGCTDYGPEFCSGCVAEGLPGVSDDCRFENPSALVYAEHCDTCSCRDREAEAHTEGFVACAAHRAAQAAKGDPRPPHTEPCPECPDGVVVFADRPERDTGHLPAWCSDGCGWTA